MAPLQHGTAWPARASDAADCAARRRLTRAVECEVGYKLRTAGSTCARRRLGGTGGQLGILLRPDCGRLTHGVVQILSSVSTYLLRIRAPAAAVKA